MPLTEAMRQRAAAIALRYPVTTDYVASLLEHFEPANVIKLLDACCAIGGHFPSAEDLLVTQED